MMGVPRELASRLLSSRLLWVMVLGLASLLLLVRQAGWYVSGQDDTVTGADLIVALGGGAGSRDVKASQLFTAGYAPRVLLTGLENVLMELIKLGYYHVAY